MPLPSSGPLSFDAIAYNMPLYGPFGPYSLKNMSIITARGGTWDVNGLWTQEPYETSSFYGAPSGGLDYGNVQILQDYSLNGYYSSPTSVVKDTSGENRDGVFVTGTGNGTATNITGYNSSVGGFMTTSNANQYAIRLNNFAKFSGTAPHSLVTWFNVADFPTDYPGLIACEGRSGSNPIGYSLYLNKITSSTFGVNYSRFSGTSGTQYNLNLTAIGAQFTTGFWYMVALVFDGSTASIIMYQASSTTQITGISGSNSYSIATDSAWSCFQGLRYNMWLNGYFGYTAIYDYALTALDIKKIQTATRLRYA